ncbi:MAG: GEVED domain-containing protein [Ferruginibacter sp.]
MGTFLHANKREGIIYSAFIRTVLFSLLTAAGFQAAAQTRTATYSTAGTYTWVAPCGVTSITVEAWGGGGAGGGVQNVGRAAGGGGAGGSYTKGTFTVTPGTAYALSVGSGGTGTTGNGGAGGNSWFNSTSVLMALAGPAGSGGVGNGDQTGAGGIAPNSGNINTGTAVVNFYGGDGQEAIDNQTSGGGGGAAGTTENGEDAFDFFGFTFGGFGGLNDGGDGADGLYSSGNGYNGTAPGGAGSGARKGNGNTSYTGGNGGNGFIRITFTLAANYYCPFIATQVEPITNVTFGTINNTTSATTGTPSATIFSHEIFCITAPNVQQGATVAISVKGNTDGNFTNYISVFVDWNQDGDFIDAGETYNIGVITNSTGVDAVTLAGSITVPATATLGTTTMRVVKNRNNTSNNYIASACTAADRGQAEDYSITVIAPPACSGTPTGGTATISATAGPAGANVTLAASGYTAANVPGISFQWQYSDNAGPWNNIAGATNPVSQAAATSATVGVNRCFRLSVTCSNGGGIGYSNSVCYTSNTTSVINVPGSGSTSVTCGSNVVLKDVGGDGTYGNNRDGYIILNNTANTNSVINISGWVRTCQTADYLNIYDGSGTTGVLLAQLSGTNNSVSFTGNPGQTLTLRFISNNNNNACDGFQLNVVYSGSCSTPYPCVPPPYIQWTSSGSPLWIWFTKISFTGTLNDVTQTSTYNPNNGAYQDFSANTNKAIQEQGGAVNVIYQQTASNLVQAWVDWNKNNTFESGELVYQTTISTASGTFGYSIPVSTVPGDYRLRIRNYRASTVAGNSCIIDAGDPSYPSNPGVNAGETEDYLFTVITRCNARVTAYQDDTKCNPGSTVQFNLNVTGSTGTTGFKWYASDNSTFLTSTTASGTPPSSTYSPSHNASYSYWVAAVGTATDGSACETPVRVKVSAIMNPVADINFNTANPITICGTGATLSVNPASGVETKYLINEDFESGTLGTFTGFMATAAVTPANNANGNGYTPIPSGYTATSASTRQWQNKTSVFTSTTTTAWRPAISSGFDTNKFAYATSDESSASVWTTLTLTNDVSTVGFTSLNFSFDMYYSHYYTDGDMSNGGSTGFDTVAVQISLNGGANWITIEKITSDVGFASAFAAKTYNLGTLVPGSLGKANFKVRFLYRAEWSDGIAVDNIKLWGQCPASADYVWVPVGGNSISGNLYTTYISPGNPGNVAYNGSSVTNIIVVPTSTQITDAYATTGYSLEFEASLELSNGCVARDTIKVIIDESLWTGGVAAGGVAGGGDDWNVAANWCSGTVPTSGSKIRIPTSPTNAKYPNIYNANTGDARFLTIESGASVSVRAGGTLRLVRDLVTMTGGTFTNNGTLSLVGNESGVSQNFPGPGTVAEMNNLTINNTSAFAPSGKHVLLNAPVSIRGELKPTAGVLSLESSDITLKSTLSGTANVSALGGTADFSYGTGRFIVERYLPVYKAWRFLATPVKVSGSPSITASWRENGAGSSTGYGTQITGPNYPSGQMDEYSVSNSLKWYNSATDSYVGVTDNSAAVANNTGYMVFVRGDRSVGITGISNQTNLRIRGELRTLNQAFTVNAGRFQSIGNPYASPVDMQALLNAYPSNLGSTFVVWDPSLAGSYNAGGFQTISALTVPAFKANNEGTPLYANSETHQHIQSGQAFFVYNSGAGNLSGNITESMKGNTYEMVSRENTPLDRQFIFTKLFTNDWKIADGNFVAFDDELSNELDADDGRKFINSGENFAMLRDGKRLSVEARGRPVMTDTIHYYMTNLRQQPYHLLIVPTQMMSSELEAYLVDRFLNTSTPVSLSDSSIYDFNVTVDPASRATDRFKLVFRQTQGPLPVTFVNISAQRQSDRSIKVNWEVANEVNIEKYEVQRSADGQNFTGIVSADATNSRQYTKNDLSPLAADNFYRVKATGIAGDITYSAIVKVAPVKQSPLITVQPNPVTDKQLNIRFSNQPAGEYTLQMTNALGQVIYKGVAVVSNTAQVKMISLPSFTSAGSYQLLILNKAGESVYSETIIVQ